MVRQSSAKALYAGSIPAQASSRHAAPAGPHRGGFVLCVSSGSATLAAWRRLNDVLRPRSRSGWGCHAGAGPANSARHRRHGPLPSCEPRGPCPLHVSSQARRLMNTRRQGARAPATSEGSSAVDPLIGATIGGRYTIRRLLARGGVGLVYLCLLYTSPSPRDRTRSRMPSSA